MKPERITLPARAQLDPRAVRPSNGGLMNKAFTYRTEAETDISKTFARHQRQAKAMQATNVRPLKKAAKP